MAAARPPLGGLVVYECRYRLGSLALHAREYVAVGIEGDRNRRVAEPLAHDLRMNARAECVCRVRMSQIVEADPRQPGAADKALKAVAELTGVDWISSSREQQTSRVEVVSELRRPAVGGEELASLGVQRDQPSAPFRLRRRDMNRMVHLHDSLDDLKL